MTEAGIGFGGNLARSDVAFARALDRLGADEAIQIRRVSSLYRSVPWGRRDQPDFLNAVAVVATSLAPRPLLERLLDEEGRSGRERTARWGPRVLDLDLLWHGSEQLDDGGLTLPHPRMTERTFVLQPLAEVAPAWRHPSSGRSARELLDELEGTSRATPCRVLEGLTLGDSVPSGSCPS